MFLTLLPYLTVAANLVLVLAILLGLNQRVRQLEHRSGKQDTALRVETGRLYAQIAELKEQILGLEQTDRSLTPGGDIPGSVAPTGNSVNNTLRSKVLKLHRLGQSPDRIAGTLRVPRGEVDLLVKVHKIVMRPYEDLSLPPLEDAPEKILETKS